MLYRQEQEVAVAAVRAAARLCEQVRQNRNPEAIEKQDRSPVTIADFGAQAIVCQTITESFPTDAIVAEEDAALLRQAEMALHLKQVTAYVQSILPAATPDAVTSWIDRGNGQVGRRFWTLDPIDGTKGFLRGDQYAIALALIEDGVVQVGAMACPAMPIDPENPAAGQGVVFVAVRNQGAVMIALPNSQTTPIQVNQTQEGKHLRLIESIEATHGDLPLQQKVAAASGLTIPPLQMDSQAKYGAVARGQAALYLRLPWSQRPDYQENIWDHAAGAIVVEEAGGRVTDLAGKPLDFASSAKMVNNRGIVASNRVLHEAVLAILQETL